MKNRIKNIDLKKIKKKLDNNELLNVNDFRYFIPFVWLSRVALLSDKDLVDQMLNVMRRPPTMRLKKKNGKLKKLRKEN